MFKTFLDYDSRRLFTFHLIPQTGIFSVNLFNNNIIVTQHTERMLCAEIHHQTGGYMLLEWYLEHQRRADIYKTKNTMSKMSFLYYSLSHQLQTFIFKTKLNSKATSIQASSTRLPHFIR